MKKQRFFNMIEVLLALAISAIGITSILGIIPLGLKANRDAMSETFAADIANSYFAELSIRAAYSADFDVFAKTNIGFSSSAGKDITVDGNSFRVYANPITELPARQIKPKTIGNDEDGIHWEEKNITVGGKAHKYYEITIGKAGTNVAPDFEADLCGWYCCPNDIPDVDNSDTDGDRNLVRVYLEVSWPVNTAYANREKRIFVREFFDTRAPVVED